MKILQIIPTLGTGGAEHFVKELSTELVRQGHECDVLLLYDIASGNSMAEDLTRNNIRIYSLHKSKGANLTIFLRIFRFIQKGGYDAVHVHVGAIKYSVLAALFRKKVKYVATIHSEARREAGNRVETAVRKFLFGKRLCQPITISEESEKSFRMFYGYSAITICNGVSDYEGAEKQMQVRDNEEQLVFIHPASCQKVKNQRLLFVAFARLAENYPNVKLIWLGSNKTFKALYDDLCKLMIPQIEYWGIVPNVRDYLAAADAMCLSSTMEGMPITIIEAFSVGCPVLTTPVGGCKNMISSGENGFLSENLSVEAYYDMLKYFCNLSAAEKEKLRAKAKEAFAAYSIEECAQKYIAVYKNQTQ